MKQIKSVTIDSSAISGTANYRDYVVVGDPGAVFSMTITNDNNKYYNFPENKEILSDEITSIAPGFDVLPLRLKPITIDASGVYSSTVYFPAVNADDEYVFTIYAEAHYETKLEMSNSLSFVFAIIPQLINTVITFDLSSTDQDAGDEAYGTYPAHYNVTGEDERLSTKPIAKTFSLSWVTNLTSLAFEVAKQPRANDFYVTTSKTTRTNGDASISLELTSVLGLSVGMVVSGTGIPQGAQIKKITNGYYNAGKSTVAFPVYEVPLIADNTDLNNPLLVKDPGGTILLSASSSFVKGRVLNFKGFGSTASKLLNGTSFSVNNFSVALTDVNTTVNDTDATGAASLTVFDIASTNGIKDDVSTVEGIGISDASTTLVTNISSNTITVDTAFKPENGQELTFLKASRTATITGDVTVTSFGSNNLTLMLELDNILTIE